MTILELKQDHDDQIRTRVLPSSILKGEDADMRDNMANELRDRGYLTFDSTASLAAQSHHNSKLIVVKHYGIFRSLETVAAANDRTTFESADVGWLWELILEGNGKTEFTFAIQEEYDLPLGFMGNKIMWKSDSEEAAAKIGKTDGGEEIMMVPFAPVPANTWVSITKDLFQDEDEEEPDDVGLTIYFRAFAGNVRVILYKQSL